MPAIDTNKLIGVFGAVILALGAIVWQNLNASISDLSSELKETTRTMAQVKEDLAVIRTKLEYVAPRPAALPPPIAGTGTSGSTGASSGPVPGYEKN